jgi:dTDP-4-amino-4,6-dideoxygalactose transaminase
VSEPGPPRRVRYADLPRRFAGGEVQRRIVEAFSRCEFVAGPEVAEFERLFARLAGTPHAVGLNSGTDALVLALRALGLRAGDEVITAPNGFIASAGAIVAAGATPIFADVTADYTLDPALVAAAVTRHTRVIMPVHLTGAPADMDALGGIAARRSLAVVEDAAQAVGAALHGRPVGSLGTVGCFSLSPLTNLGVAGDGGVLTTASRDLEDRVRLLRSQGLRTGDECEVFGYNSRLDTLQAIVGTVQLDGIEAVTKARIENAAFYDQALAHLAPEVVVPPRRLAARQVYHSYVVQVARRDHLVAHLLAHGVETRVHHPIPIHLQPAAALLGYRRGAFPVAEAQADRTLALPVHEFLTPDDLAYVANTMRAFYRD